MPQHPAILKASALVHAGDIGAAEAALNEVVDTEGDHALVAVLDDLPPKDLLAIIREYDSSKISVVGLLVTPTQFADAVVMERLYAEPNRDRLRAMINSVIFRDDVDTDEFIEALIQKEMGLEVLADYLDERLDELSIFKRTGSFAQGSDSERERERKPRDEQEDDETSQRYGEDADHDELFQMPKGGADLDEIQDRDWMELSWRLAHHFPDEFFHVFQILQGREYAALAAQSSKPRVAPVALSDEEDDDEDVVANKPGPGTAPEDESAL